MKLIKESHMEKRLLIKAFNIHNYIVFWGKNEYYNQSNSFIFNTNRQQEIYTTYSEDNYIQCN